MTNIKKLARDYYNFILKYDNIFFNKYKKIDYFDDYFKKLNYDNEIVSNCNDFLVKELEEVIRPYTNLTKGKEIEELEYIFTNNIQEFKLFLKMFDFISDECYELAEVELKKYYSEKCIKKSENSIYKEIAKCLRNNTCDNEIFSNEVIEKSNLLKEAQGIYRRLLKVYREMQEFNIAELE